MKLDTYFKELPWPDQSGSAPVHIDSRMSEKIDHRRENGFVILRNAVPTRWIEEFLRNFEAIQKNPARYHARCLHERYGETDSHHLSPIDFDHPHYRMMDLHRESLAGKRHATRVGRSLERRLRTLKNQPLKANA